MNDSFHKDMIAEVQNLFNGGWEKLSDGPLRKAFEKENKVKTIMAEEDWKNATGGATNKDWANSTVTDGLCMVCGLRGCGGHDFQTNYVRADPPEINLKPHLCPVCLGKTAVPGGFYNLDETITDAPQEKCASCNGAGYILCL